MSNKQKGRDYSELLVWAAGLVGMIRYSAAFLSSDLGQITGVTSEVITLLLGVSGFAMGLLATFGATYLFDGWRKKMPATGQTWPFKFIVLTIFVSLIFIAELAILVPFTVSRMAHSSMGDVLNGGVWWWSLAVNIMPLLLLGGVSVGNQVVTVGSGQMSENGGQMSATPSKADEKTPESDRVNVPSDWRKARKMLNDEQVIALAQMKTEDICYYYGIDERQARRWRSKAQEDEVVVVKSQVQK